MEKNKENNFKKDFVLFIICLVIYGLISYLSMWVSELIKIPNSITAILYVIFSIVLIIYLKRKNKLSYYGLTSVKNLNYKNLLYFIPMIILVSINLWQGININYSAIQIILMTICFICVGFFEELIFRGFLMKTIMNKNKTIAGIISGVLFGVIHLLNIFIGNDVLLTIIQVFYTTSFGLMCAVFFYKTNCIIPCIICHSILNVFNIFLPQDLSIEKQYIGCIVIIMLSSFYTLYLLKSKKEFVISKSENS